MEDIVSYTTRYNQYRDTGHLKQNMWKETYRGETYACALGAFLDVSDEDVADGVHKERACAASMMPEWLLDITPHLFDSDYFDAEGNSDPTFHLRWADEIYLPGGLVDRANKLPRGEREAAYETAYKEIQRRLACAMGIPPHYREEQIDVDGVPISAYATSQGQGVMRVASTIIRALDDTLTQAGV